MKGMSGSRFLGVRFGVTLGGSQPFLLGALQRLDALRRGEIFGDRPAEFGNRPSDDNARLVMHSIHRILPCT